MTVLSDDQTPVTWLGLVSDGLAGGVVSVTRIDWVAVVTAPELSVAVHVTLVVPSGSGDGRSFVKLATVPSGSVAVASPAPVYPV